MSQPPAKRHKPAPRRSSRLQPRAAQPSPSDTSAAAGGATAIAAAMPPPVAAAAALRAQLAPLEGQRRDELKRKRAEFEADIAWSLADLRKWATDAEGLDLTGASFLVREKPVNPKQEKSSWHRHFGAGKVDMTTPVPPHLSTALLASFPLTALCFLLNCSRCFRQDGEQDGEDRRAQLLASLHD